MKVQIVQILVPSVLLACLISLIVWTQLDPLSPRRLDLVSHGVYTDSFLLHGAQASTDAALPWVAESYRWDAKECLGVDHVLIASDLLVKQVSDSVAFCGGVSVFVALANISFPTIQGVQHFHRNNEEQSFDSLQCLVLSDSFSPSVFPGILPLLRMLCLGLRVLSRLTFSKGS